MKLKLLGVISFLSVLIQLQAQDPVAQQYGSMITIDDLKSNLTILASDAMEGRETGKRGQKMAAAFLKAHYEELGLTGPVNGDYYQPVELFTSIPGDIYVKVGSEVFNNFTDIAYYGTADSGGEVSIPVVFAGKGRKEDYEKLDIKDKGVLILLGPGESFRSSLETAKAQGAKMTFFCHSNADEFKNLVSQFRSYLSNGVLSLNKPQGNSNNAGVFFIAPTVAEKALNTTIDKLNKSVEAGKGYSKIKTGKLSYKTALDVKSLKTENVLGYMEGTDKKDELVVITSHYDHIGKLKSGEGDLINNGADDDGSGTVSVMQLAKVFAQAKKEGKGPRRSILFMNVTGEEKGLLGSDYYTQHPIFPLANTVVNLNIDMVGRRDPQHKDSAPYVYVIGADKLSSELNNISESTNKTYTNLIFDYTYNDQNHPDRLYYRSDHWNFAKNNIPIIFYFDGIHEDYHKPSDEVSKIEFDLLAKRAQLVFYTAWELANREQRVTPDVK